MFLKAHRWHGRDGDQKARGRFLMVFCLKPGGELRALVRHVRMSQFGHFMMARLKVKSPEAKAENDTVADFDKDRNPSFYRVADGHYYFGLSGTYGDDGLPMSAEEYPGLWEQLHPLPSDLVEKFWAGDGHNDAGSEALAMHTWAVENVARLSRLRDPGGASDSAVSGSEARP